MPRAFARDSKCPDHIIRLNALLNDELPAHRHDKLLNRADLAREIIRHGGRFALYSG